MMYKVAQEKSSRSQHPQEFQLSFSHRLSTAHAVSNERECGSNGTIIHRSLTRRRRFSLIYFLLLDVDIRRRAGRMVQTMNECVIHLTYELRHNNSSGRSQKTYTTDESQPETWLCNKQTKAWEGSRKQCLKPETLEPFKLLSHAIYRICCWILQSRRRER